MRHHHAVTSSRIVAVDSTLNSFWFGTAKNRPVTGIACRYSLTGRREVEASFVRSRSCRCDGSGSARRCRVLRSLPDARQPRGDVTRQPPAIGGPAKAHSCETGSPARGPSSVCFCFSCADWLSPVPACRTSEPCDARRGRSWPDFDGQGAYSPNFVRKTTNWNIAAVRPHHGLARHSSTASGS